MTELNARAGESLPVSPVARRTPCIPRGFMRARRKSVVLTGLTLPLALFLVVFFFAPILKFLYTSFDNSETHRMLPSTAEALSGWSGDTTPGDQAFAALVQDLDQVRQARELAILARRLNQLDAGLRGAVLRTGQALEDEPDPLLSARGFLASIDERWMEVKTWEVLEEASRRWTPTHLLAAIDLRWRPDGTIERLDDDRAIFGMVFQRTLSIASIVTLACLVLGYPVAWMISSSNRTLSQILLLIVLVPLWMSILARTAAWIILLQSNGVVNSALQFLRITTEPLDLIYNRVGVLITMTHVLLPFMIFPLYSNMMNISKDYVRAGTSLGAGPVRNFYHVYLPLTRPGIFAGSFIVFVLCLSYYITPMLVGGGADQMLSYYVAFYVNQSLNWGMAAALGVWLLLLTLVITALAARFSGNIR